MVRPRGHAQYLEPWGRRGGRRRRPWLRTAQLNLAGWSALLGACLLAAAAGVAVTAAAHGPLLLGAAWGVAPLLVVVLLDRKRWARGQTSFGWGGSVNDVARIAAELEARGVRAVVVTEGNAIGWGESAPATASDAVEQTAALEYANRDVKAVGDVLRRHGIRLPETF